MTGSREIDRKAQTARIRRVADAWLVDEGNHGIGVDDILRKRIMKETEDYAERLLPQLGFQYVLPLNNSIRIWGANKRRTRGRFPFDFYCEKDNQRWFVDITAYIKKVIPCTPLWGRLGVRIGVLFIRRDFQKYCFKDGTDKSFVSLNLQDVGLEPILSPAEVLRKVWDTRRRQGIKKKALTEEHKRHISESCSGKPAWNKGKPPWNKGLTKETDVRVAKYINSRYHKESSSVQ